MPIDPIRRILFVRTDRIGDTLLNLPAIRLVRQAHPKAWVTLLADPSLADLLGEHPDIDEFMPDGKDVYARVRQARFDLVLVSNPSKRFHWLVFRARIPVRAGVGRKWGFLLNRRLSAADHDSGHEIERNLRPAGLAAGGEWDRRVTLPVKPLAARRVERLLAQDGLTGRLIAVHAGTSNPRKRWGIDRFRELCALIRTDLGLPVVLIGGPEEKDISQKLPTAGVAADWTGDLTLSELAAFFAGGRCAALVSCDSGPVRGAGMSGTPCAALYAAGVEGCDPARWGPLDGKSVTIHEEMDRITPARVLEAVRTIVKAA